MPNPSKILDIALEKAENNLNEAIIDDMGVVDRIEYICSKSSNRSGVRVLLASSLAKIDSPDVDIRKPYTEIGDNDVYSGRVYDERFVSEFIAKNDLPCNTTTAWLTPAWRTNKNTLSLDTELIGSPRKMYRDVIFLLNKVHLGEISAEDLLTETIRHLVLVRNRRQQELKNLLKELRDTSGYYEDVTPLSTEDIVTLIAQHLESKGASRLPVLVVAAAYKTAEEYLGERVLPLEAHNAADKQTGALGDLEITISDANGVVTSYEMKAKRVTISDIDLALNKIRESGEFVNNYIFITTEIIDDEVFDYAKSLYEKTGGIEIAVLDCINFIRHFLHLFHRMRMEYLDSYQDLLLEEPDSSVSRSLKQVFLHLRINAESNYQQ